MAIVGVSRNPAETANAIFRKFKDNGYTVYPVNPVAEKVEGVRCYASVKDIPGGVGAAVLVTKPEVTARVAKDCVDAGVKWVWMHKSFGDSSSSKAIQTLKAGGVHAIPAGCPMMFLKPDGGHKAFRWFFQLTGRVPRTV